MAELNYSETVQFLREKTNILPEAAIILGTGLGGLLKEIEVHSEISYAEIPCFPVSTVESHSGKLIFGMIGSVPVVVMQGRFHFYEGYSMKEIAYPVRIFHLMGVRSLYISNACGSINLSYKKGDLMILEDHINLQSSNPLIGVHDPAFGSRFPDMSRPYDAALIHKAWNIAKREKIPVHKGVYVAVNGPNLETRAEYRFLRAIGADVVGMSTVPEVIAAVQLSMKVFAVSIVTDECDPDNLQPVTLAEILQVAGKAEPYMTVILKKLLTDPS
jgi:purine-nucleoside phosphorylase